MSPFLLFPPDLVSAFKRMAGAPYGAGLGPYRLFCEVVLQRMQRALPEGLEKWRIHAGFFGVAIDGREAHGGKLIGPPLKSVILEAYYRFTPPALPGLGEWEVPVLKAIVNGLSDAWGEFERSFSVPHLDWYPSFASCQPPVALPTANKPCFLKSLTYSALSLSSQQLLDRMARNFAPPAVKPASASHSTSLHLPLDPRSRAELMATGKVAQSANPALTQLGITAQSSPPSPPFGLPPVLPSVPPNPYMYAPLTFRTIANGFYVLVAQWFAWQQVTGAMGTGPVPTATSGVRKGNVLPGQHLRG